MVGVLSFTNVHWRFTTTVLKNIYFSR